MKTKELLLRKFTREELELIGMYIKLQKNDPELFEKVKNHLLTTLKIRKCQTRSTSQH